MGYPQLRVLEAALKEPDGKENLAAQDKVA